MTPDFKRAVAALSASAFLTVAPDLGVAGDARQVSDAPSLTATFNHQVPGPRVVLGPHTSLDAGGNVLSFQLINVPLGDGNVGSVSFVRGSADPASSDSVWRVIPDERVSAYLRRQGAGADGIASTFVDQAEWGLGIFRHPSVPPRGFVGPVMPPNARLDSLNLRVESPGAGRLVDRYVLDPRSGLNPHLSPRVGEVYLVGGQYVHADWRGDRLLLRRVGDERGTRIPGEELYCVRLSGDGRVAVTALVPGSEAEVPVSPRNGGLQIASVARGLLGDGVNIGRGSDTARSFLEALRTYGHNGGSVLSITPG